MNMEWKQDLAASGIRHSFLGMVGRFAIGIGLVVILSSQAQAQYGGPGAGPGGTGTGNGTYTPPSGGYGSSGKAIGIGVGAAAGAGVLFLALHHHGAITGCVSPSSDGLRLVDEKKNKSYAIAPDSIALQPGELVQVKGKRSKDVDGTNSFVATKVVKSLGSCKVDANVNSAATPNPSTPKK